MQNETNSVTEMPNKLNLPDFERLLPAPNRIARRSFLRSLGLGAALLTPTAGFLASASRASADDSLIDRGDAAILQFLTAAELIETDLWEQYTELALGNDAYMEALDQLDEDMPQYIADNTDDEQSHASFLNAFLHAVGRQGVNLDAFRTLPSSKATGAKQKGRLTNLQHLNVDTSWYLRYRSNRNPDFGATFPQFINIRNRPTIPPHNLAKGSKEMQAIANAAAFHFAAIEQGGTSLYAALAEKVSNVFVLKVVLGIGGSEVNHFAIWHDKAGNAPAVTVPGVSFPDIEKFNGDESRQKNLIMPEPCQFIHPSLPVCSVIRPTSIANAGAMAAVRALTNSNLFLGQSQAFLDLLSHLARHADEAHR